MNGVYVRVREECGQAIVLLTLALTVLLGMAALSVDVGYAYYVQRSLQASADAAALAGASELPVASTAEATARTYSGAAGSKNARSNVPGVVTSVTAKCVSIAPCFPVNAVQVTETKSVPTKFARVLGINSFDVKAKATACSPCSSRPLDVMLVLDRTRSMCWDHWGNYISSCPDLTNARNGLRTFVNYMDPALDRVGLAVFPPATSVGQRCGTPAVPSLSNTPPPLHYVDPSYGNASYAYVVAPLETNYRSGTGLNPSSQLVDSINCVKGEGTTAYAVALEKAQGELNANGRPDVQDVIVFFSDGAANYGPIYTPYTATSPYRAKPCRQGVTSAATIKASGTLIYSIGYDLDAQNGGANVCKNTNGNDESPSISAYSAIQQIASTGPDQYFYDQPSAGQLNTIYTKIAASITGARLIENE